MGAKQKRLADTGLSALRNFNIKTGHSPPCTIRLIAAGIIGG
jgi:hypothetical protein